MTILLTVLQAVNDAGSELGIAQTPASQVIGTRDEDVAQMGALIQSVADDLLFEEPYEYTLGDGYWLISATGEMKSRPTQDTDRILFDGRLAVTGIKYKFLQAKGLEYGEQLRDYTTRLNKLAVRANNRVLDLDEEEGRQV